MRHWERTKPTNHSFFATFVTCLTNRPPSSRAAACLVACKEEKKPDPIFVHAKGKVCPVCGKRSYSQAGIHPQCAAIQANATRAEEIRAKRKSEAGGTMQSSWNPSESGWYCAAENRIPLIPTQTET